MLLNDREEYTTRILVKLHILIWNNKLSTSICEIRQIEVVYTNMATAWGAYVSTIMYFQRLVDD